MRSCPQDGRTLAGPIQNGGRTKVAAPVADNATITSSKDRPETKEVTDESIPLRSAFEKPQENTLKAGRSTKLLDAILRSDRHRLATSRGEKAMEERSLAKRIGLTLLATPYGAPPSVVLARLSQEPEIAAAYPDLKVDDLLALHLKYPSIVPHPTTPVNFGTAVTPTTDGYLDLFFHDFAQQVGATVPSAKKSGKDVRYSLDGFDLPRNWLPDHQQVVRQFSRWHDFGSGGQRVRQAPMGFGSSLLRRVIQAAPPQWGTAEIAEEFNRSLDYYAAIMNRGSRKVTDEDREKYRMTPELVSKIMEKNPADSGAIELEERRQKFRGAILDTLKAAGPDQNLYELVEGVVASFETKAKAAVPLSKHESWGFGWTSTHRSQSDAIFPEPPKPEATLRAEDLVSYLTGDPQIAKELDRLLSARGDGVERRMAQQLASTLGRGIGQLSLVEMTRVMKAEDPVYTEDLILRLTASFPELFPGVTIERSRAERNLALGHRLANTMANIWPGASLENVAEIMKLVDPSFGQVYPNFSADDVRLLQKAYDFIPAWTEKPEVEGPSATGRMPFGTLLRMASAQIGEAGAKRIGDLVLKHMVKSTQAHMSVGATPAQARRDELPPELVEGVQDAYRVALLRLVIELLPLPSRDIRIETAAGLERSTPLPQNLPPRQAGSSSELLDAHRAIERIMSNDPAVKNLDVETIASLLTSPQFDGRDGRKISAEAASSVAKVIDGIRRFDLPAVHDALMEHLMAKPTFTNDLARFQSLIFGYTSVVGRLELDVFKNEALRSSLARCARIPMGDPDLQFFVDKYKAEQPLEDANVCFIQHMVANSYPATKAYMDLGVDPKKAIFVGIPYHDNEEVEETLVRSFDMDVRFGPKGDMLGLQRDIEKAVDDSIARHKQNGLPVLIVCDGPHARKYLRKKYPELLEAKLPNGQPVVRCVEQTANGDHPEERAMRDLAVRSIARTKYKQEKEAPRVGQAVARAVTAVMTQLGKSIEEKPVLVLGAGSIGRAVTVAMQGSGAKLYVFDKNPTPELRQHAKEHGYTLLEREEDIEKGKFMMIGCSGFLTLDQKRIMASEPGTIYVSASSKLVEVDIPGMHELSTDDAGHLQRMLAAKVNGQETWIYRLNDGTIRFVIADGLPANFNDMTSIQWEWIKWTSSAMVIAAVDVMKDPEPVFRDAHPEDMAELDRRCEAMIEGLDAEAKRAADAQSAPPVSS